MGDKKRIPGRTSLSEADFERTLALAASFLRSHDRIRNRELRRLAGLNYDQAIKFFNTAVARRILVRKGSASGTHYVFGRRKGNA